MNPWYDGDLIRWESKNALTNPEWTVKYGYATVVEYDLRSGGALRADANEGMKALGCPDVISGSKVIEADPPGPDLAHDDDSRGRERRSHSTDHNP